MTTIFDRRYSDLLALRTYEDRLEYLRLSAKVGDVTFGFDRYLNQALYTSTEWRRLRDTVILRDNGCDLGLDGYEIQGRIIIHHINPISVEDVENRSDSIFDLENLVCVSHPTHNLIHYGFTSESPNKLTIRKPGDTRLW